MLPELYSNYMALQTTKGMYGQTRLVQGTTKSVSAFVRVSQKILNTHLGSITEIFVDNVGVNGPNSQNGEEKMEGLPAV